MTGGTTSTHGHITRHTASEAHGTGAGIGVRTGTCLHGGTAGMTHGIGDGATHGTTEVIGEDGMTHGTTGDIGDGPTRGITEVIGECITLGIRIIPDGTEDSVLIGDTATALVLEAEDIFQAVHGTVLGMRPRKRNAYLPELKGRP